MHNNLLFLSGDAKLVERLEAALSGECAVMAVDPRGQDSAAVAARFRPLAIIIDAGTHTGTKTILERMAAVRAQFPALPLIAIGDEMSAQLILASFRAGVDDFIDRDASDGEIRNAVMSRLRGKDANDGAGGGLVSILSPAPSDEDADLALNVASLLAAASRDRRVLLLDLSLPMTPTRTALGLDFTFTLAAALRDMARLDRAFLDSALARSGDTGLYVLPLADDESEPALPQPRDLTVLLQILRSLFDTVVVHWGAFSHQAVRAGAIGGTILVGCTQRFSSVRNARAFFQNLLATERGADPILAIHQFDTNMTPSPGDIATAVGARSSLVLRTTWNALSLAHNRGRPLALTPVTPYGDALRTRLIELGLLTQAAPENVTGKLLNWINRARSG
jgi:Flp pilus assembly CpaE family ATPase